ncbi:hypothetical protein M218_04550 [Burkholderia pseudomallei MSHR338]|nr:hypothetical protein M218_04550 [Burkholderia pseudomallei MSHR338]
MQFTKQCEPFFNRILLLSQGTAIHQGTRPQDHQIEALRFRCIKIDLPGLFYRLGRIIIQ